MASQLHGAVSPAAASLREEVQAPDLSSALLGEVGQGSQAVPLRCRLMFVKKYPNATANAGSLTMSQLLWSGRSSMPSLNGSGRHISHQKRFDSMSSTLYPYV